MLGLIFCIFSVLALSNQKAYFSTKSRYETPEAETWLPLPDEYYIERAFLVARHGARYASSKDGVKIVALTERLMKKSRPFAEKVDAAFIKEISSKDRDLAPSGTRAMSEIGKRHGTLLAPLFPLSSEGRRLKFVSTCKQRATGSMTAYKDNFIPKDGKVYNPIVQTLPCDHDLVYRGFEHCRLYKEVHECLQMTKKEEKAIVSTLMFEKIVGDVNKRLELARPDFINADDVITLHLTCAYFILIKETDEKDGPCHFFNNEEFVALDYYMDIGAFYKRANSLKINLDVVCLLAHMAYQDVIDATKECDGTCAIGATSQDLPPIFTAGFGHAEGLIPFMAMFGIYGGNASDHYMADSSDYISSANFEALKGNRKFRTATTVPMGGNILFVTACPLEAAQEPIILVLVNEKITKLPCCEGSFLSQGKSYSACSRSQFISCFSSLSEKCNFNAKCSKPFTCQKEEK